MTDGTERPVLYLTMRWLFTWEQRRPGGCRCVCRLYHQGTGACTAPAEPGHLCRVVTSGEGPTADITDVLVLCVPCYDALSRVDDSLA
jgi:hypothetical protein